jgi:hypothetical protein
MATEEALRNYSFPAAADLSAKQYFFVNIDSNGNVALAGAGYADGVLQNKPAAAGRAATVTAEGRTKVVLGGTVNPGDEVTSDSAGKCVAVGSGERSRGICVEGGTAGLIGSVLLQPGASVA